MSEIVKKDLVIKSKYGIPIYTVNPSIPKEYEIKRNRKLRIGNDRKGIILNNGNGEIINHGGALIYEWEEVDKERFVKLYLGGLKQASGLTKAGLSVFEFVYHQLRDNHGKDFVLLDAISANMEERSYQRGLRDLLKKEFLFRSTNPGLFFVNIRFMFNGDRLAFIKGYTLQKTKRKKTSIKKINSED